MSKGPSGIKDEDIKYNKYYNLKLDMKDWCLYDVVCEMYNNIGENYCWACEYRKPLDIPELLKRSRKEKK